MSLMYHAIYYLNLKDHIRGSISNDCEILAFNRLGLVRFST